MCNASPKKDVHAIGERMKTFPTFEWSIYLHVSHGNRNYDVEQYQRRQPMLVNPSKKKEDHFSS
jgi:hypothetical protein